MAFVFLRQFGSAFALRQAQSLNRYHDEIVAAGAKVVFIGLGTSIQGFTFRKRSQTRFLVLTTHDQTLYRTMGLWRYRRGTIGLSNLGPWLELMREGVYPYQRTGDPYQLGGVFVATAGGREVTWDFRAHRACDVAHSAGDVVIDSRLRTFVKDMDADIRASQLGPRMPSNRIAAWSPARTRPN